MNKTYWVSDLEIGLIDYIKGELTKQGQDLEDIENALNSKVHDLEENFNIKELQMLNNAMNDTDILFNISVEKNENNEYIMEDSFELIKLSPYDLVEAIKEYIYYDLIKNF